MLASLVGAMAKVDHSKKLKGSRTCEANIMTIVSIAVLKVVYYFASSVCDSATQGNQREIDLCIAAHK